MMLSGWRLLKLAYPLIALAVLMTGSWFSPDRIVFWMYVWMIPIIAIGGLAFLGYDRIQHKRRLKRSLATRALRFSFGDRVVVLEGERWGPTRIGTIGTPPRTVLSETGPWISDIALVQGNELYFWVYFDEPFDLPEGDLVDGAAMLDRDMAKAEPLELAASAASLVRSPDDENESPTTRH